MWRFLAYSALLYLLTPAVLLRLVVRGFRNRGYWHRWNERFGFIPVADGPPPIWVHAVSVGEALAALSLIEELRRWYPDARIVVTTTTPTGSERVRRALGEQVHHVYAPYDLPDAVARFLDRVRPRLAVIMETELWPNLFRQLSRRDIPIVLANARLSARSAAGYAKFPTLTRMTLDCISEVAAQSDEDAGRFLELGMDRERVAVTGSIKFDMRQPASVREAGEVLRQSLGADRPVWVAASTHEGEDEPVLHAFAIIRQKLPDTLLVLVPRHPERFRRVESLCRRQGYKVVCRSQPGAAPSKADVFLGDTMGELPVFYAASDLAFVGGSLVPVGGHNVLEPAALGIAVVTGPYTHNFKQITCWLIEAGGATAVNDADALGEAVAALLLDPERRTAMGEQGRRLVEANRGALEALMRLVAPLLQVDRA